MNDAYSAVRRPKLPDLGNWPVAELFCIKQCVCDYRILQSRQMRKARNTHVASSRDLDDKSRSIKLVF